MVAQNSDKLIGHQLDQYHIEQLLTQRKSSALYLARDVRSEGEVLLEVAKQSVKENQHFADAFQHNMSVIQTLGQPNIAKVLQISQSSGKRPFAVSGGRGCAASSYRLNWQACALYPPQ